jgi:hypothetical protein
MVLGGRKYESLRRPNQDNDDDNDSDNQNDRRNLSPTLDGRGGAWASLTRTESDQSASYDFELSPGNDRTGLTSAQFTTPPYVEHSQENLLGDRSDGSLLQPPSTPTTRRNRGFHHSNNPSNVSALSSAKSTRSSAPSSTRLSSMKHALGRASSRVMNISGSSFRNQISVPVPVPEGESLYSKAATENNNDSDDDQEDQDEEVLGASHESDAQGRDGSSTHVSPIGTQPPHVPLPSKYPPLEGYSLFIFGPENPLRIRLNKLLHQT